MVVITGPTAVGKSELAFDLARRMGAEIISADSRQVYRYMDIGTAKPGAAERAAVPHHMVDVAYPDEPYSVAEYWRAGERMLADIASRGRVALVVGGSPHYIQALVDRLRPPPRHPALRGWLERADAAAPPGRLDDWLGALDPLSARAIDGRNRRRVLRAIEVALLTGRPYSQVGHSREAPIPAVRIGLRRDRRSLYQRVEGRVAAMLRDGWLEEVRTLLAMGYSAHLPAMTAAGYAELARVVQGEATLAEATERIRFAVHAFIRRQETWMRGDPGIHWLDAADPGVLSTVIALATQA